MFLSFKNPFPLNWNVQPLLMQLLTTWLPQLHYTSRHFAFSVLHYDIHDVHFAITLQGLGDFVHIFGQGQAEMLIGIQFLIQLFIYAGNFEIKSITFSFWPNFFVPNQRTGTRLLQVIAWQRGWNGLRRREWWTRGLGRIVRNRRIFRCRCSWRAACVGARARPLLHNHLQKHLLCRGVLRHFLLVPLQDLVDRVAFSSFCANVAGRPGGKPQWIFFLLYLCRECEVRFTRTSLFVRSHRSVNFLMLFWQIGYIYLIIDHTTVIWGFLLRLFVYWERECRVSYPTFYYKCMLSYFITCFLPLCYARVLWLMEDICSKIGCSKVHRRGLVF